MKDLGCRRESNPGPLALATYALTTELRQCEGLRSRGLVRALVAKATATLARNTRW